MRPAANGATSLSDFADPLWVLLGGAGLVLLIACANLGNLLLARTTARVREVAVRLALGAGRGRLVRQLLTESLCLAVAGGICGLGLAFALRQALIRLLVDPIVLPATLDRRVLLFVFVLTLVVGLMLGLLPALRITKTPVATGLRDQGRGIAGSAAWLRIGRLVVVGQLALSLPLLVGAGLLARTLVNLQRAELGYAKDGLLTVSVDAQAAGYEPARQAQAFEDLLARVRAVPGVRVATFSNNGLFGGSDNGDQITVEGYTPKGDGDRGSSYDAVGPGYFSTLGVPVMAGREITGQDRAGGAQVCVINETFARRFFAGRHPIGLHVTQRYADQSHTYEVVGVVKDSRQNRLRGRIEHRFYTPATQPAASISAVSFIIRPRGDGAEVLPAVRRVIQQAEPRMSITRAGALGEAIDRRLSQDRMVAQLSIAFGVVAALLAAMGLYGVLSYGVARRTQELGVRKALGARHATLMADDHARDRLAARRGARRRRRARRGRGAADREPPLRPVAGGSGDVRRRDRRARHRRVRRDVAAGIPRVPRRSARRATPGIAGTTGRQSQRRRAPPPASWGAGQVTQRHRRRRRRARRSCVP